MILIITIDTEEDNWARYSTFDNPIENIKRIIPLQQLFDRYGVRPTYLISYPVATNPVSISILKKILDEGKCEIGMHCHPWNTPPFEEEICDVNSMLCNLPESLVLEKLRVLHGAIRENFGIAPVSFRSGRWGFSSSVARALLQLGYRIDTSVSPFVDWCRYNGPDYSTYPFYPYRFDPSEIATPQADGPLLEIPATVGFLQHDFVRCQKWIKYTEADIGQKLHLKGIFSRLGLLNRVWLSPELEDANTMIQLANRMKKKGAQVINMSFHSTTLMAGLTPFVINSKDESIFFERVDKFLLFVRDSGWYDNTLSQFERNSLLL
jgi:hypothetical protein